MGRGEFSPVGSLEGSDAGLHEVRCVSQDDAVFEFVVVDTALNHHETIIGQDTGETSGGDARCSVSA